MTDLHRLTRTKRHGATEMGLFTTRRGTREDARARRPTLATVEAGRGPLDLSTSFPRTISKTKRLKKNCACRGEADFPRGGRWSEAGRPEKKSRRSQGPLPPSLNDHRRRRRKGVLRVGDTRNSLLRPLFLSSRRTFGRSDTDDEGGGRRG